MSRWKEGFDPESSRYRDPVRGREGFDGRRVITQQENFRDMQQIRSYLFRLVVIAIFMFVIFIGAAAAMLYFAFGMYVHIQPLEDIEKQTEQALIFLMEILNSTNEVTKDMTTAYSRAKIAHRRSAGSITEQEYQQYLSDSGINEPVVASDPFSTTNHINESYTTHLMHILLRSLPLEDEDKMTARFKNFFDGFDSLMHMLSVANDTHLVQNISATEKRINDILYSGKSEKLFVQSAELASTAMEHSQIIVDKAIAANRSVTKLLGRLDQLSRTELVKAFLNNEHNVLQGAEEFMGELYETLHDLVHFFRSDQGHTLIGDTEDIVGALNKFHTAKRATQLLHLLLDFGSRTLNIDVEEEEGLRDDPEPARMVDAVPFPKENANKRSQIREGELTLPFTGGPTGEVTLPFTGGPTKEVTLPYIPTPNAKTRERTTRGADKLVPPRAMKNRRQN